MPMRVRKAVFPAAGLGTRFLPATKAQPKEMLPLVDKPIIQYGVEEAMASGCDQIIIVTGRGKTSIEDHFDVSYELEKMLEERKKTPGLDPSRAPTIVAGVEILLVVLELFGLSEVEVSEHDILRGAALGLS